MTPDDTPPAFEPPWWMKNPHVQTILPTFVRQRLADHEAVLRRRRPAAKRQTLLPRRLPVLLARKGYDVWVAHHRGSIFSPGHLIFNTSDWVRHTCPPLH